MQPPQFLIGKHPQHGLIWASIDPVAHHLQPRVGERRFAAYLAPFPNQEAAKRALMAAGATQVMLEERKQRRRG